MFVINGCPKSGTHALMALLDTMGLKRVPGTILPLDDNVYVYGNDYLSSMQIIPDNCYILGHVADSHAHFLNGFRVITVFRDPRNVLVSYCRHQKRNGVDVTIRQALEDFWDFPFIEVYRSYLGWFGKSMVVRYEDMPDFVIGNGDGIYQGHEQDWNTRTGSPSSWQEVWTKEDEASWIEAGGPELLVEAGY
jgi:hypothetical protein